MNNRQIGAALRHVRRVVSAFRGTSIAMLKEKTSGDPFRILISCLISLRTKDAVTAEASRKLYARADTPAAMVRLTAAEIENLIYPAGFYRNKARTIREVSQVLLERFGGKVPDTLEGLLSLKGVGRKTANLVVTEAFGKDGICVDTHVHRISNRWGYVVTSTPEETETALRAKLPRRYWREYNDLLVSFGQNVCRPVAPRCQECPLTTWCGYVRPAGCT